MGSSPSFETCAGRWTASGFANEDVLQFILQGVDAVGNMAPMISHQWIVGKLHICCNNSTVTTIHEWYAIYVSRAH